MIDAERGNKLGSEFQLATPRSEDLLTSNTFGRLKYLPWSAFTKSFSGIDWKIANHRIPDEEDQINFKFWSRMGRDEIDVLIKTGKTIIGIEIKFNSPLSGSNGEDHQLLRYARAIEAKAKREGKIPFLI